MKTTILATAAVLALGVGSAFAGDGDGPAANTTFTQLPGVIAQAQVGQAPSAYARNQVTGKPTAAFVTTSRSSGTWLFAPNPNQGANS
ncbi:MAG TPA: hypothetical protein VK822_17125 [Acetobacteraceae bacterium]|jgi:hypothetical protein|nr:hypothetical protein [Acetobacteraceae bacterium]